MKTFDFIWKLILALAALAGLIFVIVKYGDKIVAWCKRLVDGCCCCVEGEGEPVSPEEPAEEAPVAEDQAAEEDFENC